MYRALAELGDVEMFIVGSNLRPSFKVAKERYNIVGSCQPMPRGERSFMRLVRPVHPKAIDLVATAFGRRARDYEPDPRVAAAVNEVLESRRYDLVVGRYLRPTIKTGLFGRMPLVVDMDDLDTDVYETRLERPGLDPITRVIVRSHARQMHEIMHRVVPLTDSLIVAKPMDVDRVNHDSVHIVPNLPFAIVEHPEGEFQPEATGPPIVLFVGAAGHRVNVEGVLRFVNECWPQIRRAAPDATFRIVGAGGWNKYESQMNNLDGVEIVGFADDLAEAYRDCVFTVAPLFEGGGTKIKVLESLYYGRAALVTEQANRGYDQIRAAGGVRVASTEAEIITAAIEMLGTPESCRESAAIGHAIVLDNYGFARFKASVAAAVDSAMRRSEPRAAVAV